MSDSESLRGFFVSGFSANAVAIVWAKDRVDAENRILRELKPGQVDALPRDWKFEEIKKPMLSSARIFELA